MVVSPNLFDTPAWDSLTKSEKMVYLCLALRFNETTGSCFPSLSTIAKDAGMNRSIVSRCIKALNIRNAISYIAGYKGRSNTYIINIPVLFEDFKKITRDIPINNHHMYMWKRRNCAI